MHFKEEGFIETSIIKKIREGKPHMLRVEESCILEVIKLETFPKLYNI